MKLLENNILIFGIPYLKKGSGIHIKKKPGQGYTKENILLICSAVNLLKSNWDMDTVVYICKQIVNNYGS